MKLETLAVHAGHAPDSATGAVTPPISLSTTFERAPDGSMPHGWVYSRYSNPNRDALERLLAALEGGSAAAAFSSGQAATMTVLQSLAPGDHVVMTEDAYFGTLKLARELFTPWGLQFTFVDARDASTVERAMRRETRLVWLESPSNPLLAITDLARIAAAAKKHGARTIVDNTWATPALQRPLDLGCDLVMHSTTKYLGGHSDILGGAIVGREDDELFQRVRAVQGSGGAVPSPFECWLVMRGARTLPYRMRGHCANARAVAEFLASHPRVERVHYPGLPSHPGHPIAAAQMSDFGGMLSIQVRGGAADALRVASRVQLFTRATSLGGPESLIEHRHSVEGPGSRAPENLLRLSIGLEHAEDIIADLSSALR
ncbi:MAG TPA: aminotransferase class V-fold PLP-dependent enzyme [Gemmatimonadaceae bacterium]|nr:aminotransferase class V-fold PLP-dependent enzyme [Gemmatimonadaceae bacterium]